MTRANDQLGKWGGRPHKSWDEEPNHHEDQREDNGRDGGCWFDSNRSLELQGLGGEMGKG